MIIVKCKNMPKYTPTIHYCGKGEYKEAIGAISVIFENHPSPHNVAEFCYMLE